MTKLLCVVECSHEVDPEQAEWTLKRIQRKLEGWVQHSTQGVLVLGLAPGMELEIHQIGPDVLQKPPKIEVVYEKAEGGESSGFPSDEEIDVLESTESAGGGPY